MSITRVRENIEKPGCQRLFAVVLCLAFGGSLLRCNIGQQNGATPNAVELEKPIGTIGGAPIYGSLAQQFFDQMKRQATEAPTAGQAASQLGGGLNNAVAAATLMAIAKQENITATDAEIAESARSGEIDAVRNELTGGQGSQADFEKALESRTGKSYKDFTENLNAQINASLKVASYRDLKSVEVLRKKLMEKYAREAKLSDDDSKRVYDTLKVKQIICGDPKKAGEALAAIKGGMSFDDAIDKFSDIPAQEGKKKSDESHDVNYSSIIGNPDLGMLKNLKEGDNSNVIPISGAQVIFKIVKIIPADSKMPDKEKGARLRAATGPIAIKKLEQQSDALIEKFKGLDDPGFDSLFQWMRPLPKKSEADYMTMARQLVEQPAKAEGDASASANAAARYMALETIWNKLKPEEQTKLLPNRAEIITNMSKISDSAELEVQLADALIGLKDKKVGEVILSATRANSGAIDATGRKVYGELEIAMNKAKAAGLVNEAMTTQFTALQKQWMDSVQAKAEADRKEALERQKAEEEQKKQEAEAKKKLEEAKKKESAGVVPQKREAPASPTSGSVANPVVPTAPGAGK